ncbi:PfkB family carbohydrate kinase, partial [Acinetobacter baumannii]
QRIETDAGGKGINLSRVAAELGVKTVATGFLGGSSGDLIRRVMRDQGVIDACLEVPAPTRIVWSVESGDGPPTTLNGAGGTVSGE